MKLRAALLLGILVLAAIPAAATIEYRVSLAQPNEHLFRVTMTVPNVQEELVVAMPAWNAFYQIRDFAHRVQNVRARAEDGALLVAKDDKQTWRISRNWNSKKLLGRIVVEYSVYWDDPGPFSAQLNSTHGFLNLAMVLFYVPSRRGEDAHLELTDLPSGWSAATALKPGNTSFTFRAGNYDLLVDAPVEVSAFEETRLEVAGAKIRVVVHGTDWDRGALMDSIRRIVAYQIGLMRETPFDEFLFIYHFGMGGSGGMEHANSTAIDLAHRGWAAGVTAHEFFHLWNVKRIRPRSLEPVDYSREQWTRSLWFAEGITNTYGAYTLVRTELWSPRQFYEDLGEVTGQLESRPAYRWQSAEQSSLDAWHEKYPLYVRPEFSVSYYGKGQVLGVLLDILIRDATNNRASLDDVLRHMNSEFARRGRFYDDGADIRAAVEKMAGRDFGEFFARYVAGVDPLPFRATLALAGLTLTPRGRSYTISENPDSTEKQRRIREGLLRGTTD
jgi:predicted metalloprotease with PDZ domain